MIYRNSNLNEINFSLLKNPKLLLKKRILIVYAILLVWIFILIIFQPNSFLVLYFGFTNSFLAIANGSASVFWDYIVFILPILPLLAIYLHIKYQVKPEAKKYVLEEIAKQNEWLYSSILNYDRYDTLSVFFPSIFDKGDEDQYLIDEVLY